MAPNPPTSNTGRVLDVLTAGARQMGNIAPFGPLARMGADALDVARGSAAAQRDRDEFEAAAKAPDVLPPQTRAVSDGASEAGAPSAFPVSAAPQFATQTTTTTQGAAISRGDAARLRALGKEHAADAKAAVTAHATGKRGVLAQTEALQRKLAADAQQYATQLGRRGDAVHKKFQALDAEFAQLKKEAKESDVSVLGGYDNTARALLAVNAALEGTVAGLAGRPSQVSQVVSMAVNQDMTTQRANLQKRLRLLNMTERQRDAAFAQWDRTEGQRRSEIARVASLQLGQLATKTDSLDTKMKAADAILQIRKDLIGDDAKLLQASRSRSSTTSVRKQVAGAGMLPGKISPKDDTRLEASRRARIGLQSLPDEMASVSGGGGVGRFADQLKAGFSKATGIPVEESKVEGMRRQAIANAVKAVSGVAARPDEKADIALMFPSLADAPAMRRDKMAAAAALKRDEYIAMAQQRQRQGNAAAAQEFFKEAQNWHQLTQGAPDAVAAGKAKHGARSAF